MSGPDPASFWDGVRAWADSLGVLLPLEDELARPRVPQSVCDSCPVCQAAATLGQVDPQVLVEISDLARGLVAGLASALASAADQRTSDPAGGDASGEVPG